MCWTLWWVGLELGPAQLSNATDFSASHAGVVRFRYGFCFELDIQLRLHDLAVTELKVKARRLCWITHARLDARSFFFTASACGAKRNFCADVTSWPCDTQAAGLLHETEAPKAAPQKRSVRKGGASDGIGVQRTESDEDSDFSE